MSDQIRPRRSVLYMPGSNARALEKARQLDVDALILDLEDSVAPDAKPAARALVGAAIAGGYGFREVLLRINGLKTQWGTEDLEAAIAARPDGVLVPKIETAADILWLEAALNRADPGGKVALWAMIETPLAILDIRNIAATAAREGARLKGFVLGTNDLAKETGARLVPGRTPMMPWLMQILAAGRAYGLAVIDGVYNDLDDEDGFAAECRQGRDMGFDGKTLVHPRQIETANAIFMPDPDEVAWARKIADLFALPDNAGKGALRVEGKMVERLHAEMARRQLAMVAAIEARQVGTATAAA